MLQLDSVENIERINYYLESVKIKASHRVIKTFPPLKNIMENAASTPTKPNTYKYKHTYNYIFRGFLTFQNQLEASFALLVVFAFAKINNKYFIL